MRVGNKASFYLNSWYESRMLSAIKFHKFWVNICDQIIKLTEDFFPPNSHEGMFPPPPDDDIYDGIEEEDAVNG